MTPLQANMPDLEPEQPATQAELDALEIIEAGPDVTDNMVGQLERDELLLSYVRSGLALREDVCRTTEGIDMEARLALFQAKHAEHPTTVVPGGSARTLPLLS